LTTSIKERFDKDGYVVLRNHFSKEYVQRLKEEARTVLEKMKKNNTGVYLGMALASPLFKEAAADSRLVSALREVIGNRIIFMSDKIVFKNAQTDFGSPWHQDYPYWYGSHKFSVWIALDEADSSNGCLRVVPGSHLLGSVNHGGQSSDGLGFDNRLRHNDVDPTKIVDLPASQGDAILFSDLLFHSSYPNTSGKDRWALISTYKDGYQEDKDYGWAEGAFTVSS
jgi:ectoine hydroxylase-related dioxygenase (phytanoyl-CoA dioxygenase family)